MPVLRPGSARAPVPGHPVRHEDVEPWTPPAQPGRAESPGRGRMRGATVREHIVTPDGTGPPGDRGASGSRRPGGNAAAHATGGGSSRTGLLLPAQSLLGEGVGTAFMPAMPLST
ncbi:hypothetical protein SCWH03_57210 [Streptomyces pacificus]|uniref:Uncharacterized protein n=1 Tax=Streptomyces pacificus TaxID=2705029 RepID=A0A6A0B5B3_9ACTN|nr:hypothetical protein SCWH03_57210 [Streptomyces pacificus]